MLISSFDYSVYIQSRTANQYSQSKPKRTKYLEQALCCLLTAVFRQFKNRLQSDTVINLYENRKFRTFHPPEEVELSIEKSITVEYTMIRVDEEERRKKRCAPMRTKAACTHHTSAVRRCTAAIFGKKNAAVVLIMLAVDAHSKYGEL